MVSPQNAWDRLFRTMRQINPNDENGAWQILMSGTVNTIGGGVGGTATVDNQPFTPGGTSITPAGGYFGGRSVGSGNAAAFAINGSGVLQVDVISGAAGGGGGFATVGVWGSVSILGSVNIGGQPISVIGSVNSTLQGIPTVNLGLGTINVGNAHGIFGSVSMLGSVNVGGVVIADVRGSLVPTQWIISGAASGQMIITGSAPAAQRIYLSSMQLIATGTVDLQWQSPSGAALTGSMRLLPGAGFGMAGAMPNGPVVIGAVQGALYLNTAGTQNIGGMAVGWIGP